MKRSLIVIVNGAGELIHAPIGIVTGNAQFRDGITVITPLDLKDVVSIVFSKRNRIEDDVTQYLVPQGKLKGKDILPQNHDLYQEVYDWNVFEDTINEKALTYLTKYRGGVTKASINAGVQITPHNAENYEGIFGVNNPLPNDGMEDGDYYVCKDYNYKVTLDEVEVQFTLDDIAYWHDDQWHKSNYRSIFGTEAFDVPVSSNIQSHQEIQEEIPLEHKLAGDVAVLEVAIDTHDGILEGYGLLIAALNQNKLNKYTPPEIPYYSDVLYAVDKEGNQIMLWVNKDALANTVVIRTDTGHMITANNPFQANHVVNKAYADGKLSVQGGALLGFLDMTGNEIRNVKDFIVANGGKNAVNADGVKGYATPLSRLIAGLNLQNDITADELVGQLRVATTTEKGLMSVEDKQNLQTLLDLLEDDAEGTINTIKEIFEVFEGFSDDVVLIDLLNAKVNLTDKINGVTMANLISSGLWAEKVLFSDTNVGDELVRLETDKIDKSNEAGLLLNTDKAKLDQIKDDGVGDKYLGDNLEYKTIKANEVKTSEAGAYGGKGVEEALDQVREIAGVLRLDFGFFTDDEEAVPLFDLGGFV